MLRFWGVKKFFTYGLVFSFIMKSNVYVKLIIVEVTMLGYFASTISFENDLLQYSLYDFLITYFRNSKYALIERNTFCLRLKFFLHLN